MKQTSEQQQQQQKITRDGKGHYIIHQEEIAILNVHTPKGGVAKHMRQKQ